MIRRLKDLGRDPTLGAEEKRKEQQAIISKLAKELDFETCLQLIADAVGDGDESLPLVSALFEASPETFAGLLDRVSGLPASQPLTAMTALSMRSQVEDFDEAQRLPLFRKALEVDGTGSLVPAMIRFELAVAGTTDDSVRKIEELVDLSAQLPEYDKNHFLSDLVSEAAAASPFHAWELLGQVKGEPGMVELRDQLLLSMMAKSPARMMDTATSGTVEDHVSVRAYQIMLTSNPKMAEQWLAANQSKLRNDLLDQMRAVSKSGDE